MKTRVVRISLLVALGAGALLLPTSGGALESGRDSAGARSTTLLIPAKTRLIISYTRRALA